MGLETANWISDLTATNPISADLRSQGDDHIRMLKTVLKNTFPNAGKAFYLPDTEVKVASFSAIASDLNKTFLVATTAGAIVATLPVLASGDAGWFCFILKTTTDLNPIYITPPSGTIQSGPLAGLAKTRRCIPGVPCRVWWTGSAWFAERAEKSPVGTLIDFYSGALPVGYELPNGQVLTGVAGSIYPDFFAAMGVLSTPDVTGRVVAMKEAVAIRLTVAKCGIDGSVNGAAGGEDGHVLTAAESAALVYTSTVTDPQHAHAVDQGGASGGSIGVSMGVGQSFLSPSAVSPGNTNSAATGITVATNSNAGGGVHNNAQPTIVLNKLIVVE